MKKILLLIFLFANIIASAEEFGQICIASFVPVMDNVPERSRALLENKLSSIITDAGYASNWNAQRFVITAKLNSVTRNIVPGTPTRISQDFEVKLIIGDIVTNEIFASHIIRCHGIGKNEEQCQIQAFQHISPGTENLNSFVKQAAKRINEFYINNCSSIIMEAQVLGKQEKYDEAIFRLLAVPSGCESCYVEVQNLVVSIYQQSLDSEGKKYVQEAMNVWSSRQDYYSATQALEILTKVNVNSSALDDATKLAKSISSKLRNDERLEYEFMLRQYNDSIAGLRLKEQHSHEATMAFINVLDVFASKPRLAPVVSNKRSIF